MATVFSLIFLVSIIFLVVGLIRPSTIKFKSRKLVLIYIGGVAIISFIAVGLTAPAVPATNNQVKKEEENKMEDNHKQEERVFELDQATTTQQTIATATEQVVASADNKSQKPSVNQLNNSINIDLYYVTSIVDGDTIKVDVNGTIETIRLIGIDTPETVDPRKPVQCFGKEASTKAKELLSGKKIKLEYDETQSKRDKYNRLLAYIYREDGLFFNKYMIEQGYAHEYTYITPYKFQAEFKAAQKFAQENLKGFWSLTTCNGDTTSIMDQSDSNQDSITAKNQPTVSPTNSKYYTSSYSTAKYYYPENCDGWKSLNTNYLKSFDSLNSLLEAYPSRKPSPSCQ